MTPAEIIRENERRWKQLRAPYDPILGVGSPIKRIKVRVFEGQDVFLPEEMVLAYKAIVELAKSHGSLEQAIATMPNPEARLREFNSIRCKYDFEFWASTCVKILTKRKGLQPFILNRPQRKYLAKLEQLRLAGVPIRIILLKARQWGGSTLTEIYISWIQMFWQVGWNALIIADVKEKAQHIRKMYDRMIENHPVNVLDYGLELRGYERSANFKEIPARNAIVGVTSVETPEAPRSFTLHMLHLSEVGLWKSTPQVNAESLIQSLEGSLVDGPYTLLVKESTAKGVGNYFHRSWQRAVSGESVDVPVFVSWYEDPNDYFRSVKDPAAFVKTWSDYDKFLWDQGATIEHIAWYRWKRKTYEEDFQMKSEYPTTPEEAFQSTGHRYFATEYVNRARKNCKDPIARGDLNAGGNVGEEALSNIVFDPSPRGFVKIWTFPGKAGIEVAGKLYTNRYCAFADVGHRSDGADYNVVTILDRIYTLWGGVPIVAAEFHGHLDPDLFAWQAARLARWYEDALLAVEVNTLISEAARSDVTGDEQSFTVLNQVKEYYDNLYYRIRPETIQEVWNGVLGFHMNKQTKPMVLASLNAALRDEGYEERSLEACAEFDYFEHKTGGRTGAVEGEHDDRVISRAGAIWLSGEMDPVEEVDLKTRKTRLSKPGHMAQFS